MRANIILFCCCSVSVIFGCDDDVDANRRSMQVELMLDETYLFDTGIFGDEDGASISKQASHFQISEIIRNESTNFSATYTYTPANGYKGKDEVELKLSSGSDGSSRPTLIEYVTIHFLISE